MLSTHRSTSPSITQRTAFSALVALAFVLYFGLQVIGYPLAAVGAFVVLFGGAIGLVARSSNRLFDERDQQLHERAAGHTVALYGWLCAVAFPTLIVLETFDQVESPGWLDPIGAAIFVFFITYVVIQMGLRFNQ